MFYKLSDELKLEASFQILANLSVYIKRRRDLNKTVSDFLVSFFPNIIKVQSNLVMLRVVRLTAYYPHSLYFYFIEATFSKGKVFILEGIKSFERIIRSNSYF